MFRDSIKVLLKFGHICLTSCTPDLENNARGILDKGRYSTVPPYLDNRYFSKPSSIKSSFTSKVWTKDTVELLVVMNASHIYLYEVADFVLSCLRSTGTSYEVAS